MLSLSRCLRIARATAHAACGWLSYRLGWYGVARQQFERVLLLRGADFRAYVHLGRIAFDHGDYAGWRREFEHARRTDPIRFARLRHAIELFEPRLAGTQFEGHGELDGFQGADSRATWRALHPFQDPRGMDHVGDELGADALDARGKNLIHGKPHDDGRTPDGYGRSTDLPLAPGYDPMTPGQQLDESAPDESQHEHPRGDASGNDASGNDGGGDAKDTRNTNPLGLDDLGTTPNDPRNRPFTGHPSWNTPDAVAVVEEALINGAIATFKLLGVLVELELGFIAEEEVVDLLFEFDPILLLELGFIQVTACQ